MKKISDIQWIGANGIIRLCGWLLLSLFLAGCAEKQKQTEKIIIRGSNTVGEELAPRLIAEYKKEHPEVVFDTEFKGTTYGFGALMAGNCDVAAASREVTANEVALARDNGVELADAVIGAYSVAVIVGANNSVGNLATNQVRDIFTGTVTNWQEVGGPDAPIHLYIRNPISGTYLGFQEVAMERKPYAMTVKAFISHSDIVNAVAKDPNGIGYSSLDVAKNPGVKMVSIGGVAPTASTATHGQYPYARILRLYTNKGTPSATANGFVQFIVSDRGQKILGEMGFAPKP